MLLTANELHAPSPHLLCIKDLLVEIKFQIHALFAALRELNLCLVEINAQYEE